MIQEDFLSTSKIIEQRGLSLPTYSFAPPRTPIFMDEGLGRVSKSKMYLGKESVSPSTWNGREVSNRYTREQASLTGGVISKDELLTALREAKYVTTLDDRKLKLSLAQHDTIEGRRKG
jgi:hypothetical protein